jgi:hypothetical protein
MFSILAVLPLKESIPSAPGFIPLPFRTLTYIVSSAVPLSFISFWSESLLTIGLKLLFQKPSIKLAILSISPASPMLVACILRWFTTVRLNWAPNIIGKPVSTATSFKAIHISFSSSCLEYVLYFPSGRFNSWI